MEEAFKETEQDLTNSLRTTTEGAADPPRRKRGAKPGNQNARKHGFYAKSMTPEQQDALVKARQADFLAEEIAMLRVTISALAADPDTDPDLILRAMSLLARMVRMDDRMRFVL